MQEPIIEFRDFGFQYNAQAEPTLKNINLTVRRGAVSWATAGSAALTPHSQVLED